MDFLKPISTNKIIFLIGLITFIVAVVNFILILVTSSKNKKAVKCLENQFASHVMRDSYIICPECLKKIYLKDINVYTKEKKIDEKK